MFGIGTRRRRARRTTPTSIGRYQNALIRKLKAKLDTELNQHLLDIIDTRTLSTTLTPGEAERLRRTVERVASKTLKAWWRKRLSPEQRARIVTDVTIYHLGFGPLESLLRDPLVSEIMVNGPSEIFVERRGQLERTSLTFRTGEELMAVLERALSGAGRWVSQAEPYVDVHLADGIRANIAISPVAVGGPFVTIRKFPSVPLSMQQLVRGGSVSLAVAEFLHHCVRGRVNIVVSGPAAAGKTTMMNALANLVSADERIVLIEETAEVRLPGHHVTRLETRLPNIEGRGEITMRNLLLNALHMRPDRILLGEIRGPEALEMLQAMTTGHEGSIATIHANSPYEVVDRLTTFALLSQVGLSPVAVERQVHSAVDLIVHVERFGDGSRRVTHVCDVAKPMEPLALVELFVRTEPQGPPGPGALVPTGKRPGFLQRLAQRDIQVPERLFASAQPSAG